MQLSLQSFNAWVQQQAAAAQASAAALLNVTTGSILLAILEANASVALWLQWLIVQVMALTRAATSNGFDLDSWMAQFSFVRALAVYATGAVTFSRFSTSVSALIPVGTTVKTADGTQQFTVTQDATNSIWSATLGGYLIPAGTVSGTVPVQAVNPGTQANVAAGTISLIATALAGVDTVNNGLAFTNGVDAQSDSALRSSFQNYINTRSRGTLAAIGFAVSTVGQNLTWTIEENKNADGSTNVGHFTIYVDDGTGAPVSTLLAAVYAAVDAYRPIGTTFAVLPPAVVNASISFTLTAAPGYLVPTLDGIASQAVTAFVSSLPMGAALPYNKLAQIIFNSSPGIANVGSLTVNGGTADIGGGANQVVRLSALTAS